MQAPSQTVYVQNLNQKTKKEGTHFFFYDVVLEKKITYSISISQK